MLNKPLIKTDLEVKSTRFAGIDVGVEELVQVIHKNGRTPRSVFAQIIAQIGAALGRLRWLVALLSLWAATALAIPQAEFDTLFVGLNSNNFMTRQNAETKLNG